MKVSAQEEYGLRCLLQLARLGEGESLTLGQVAEGEVEGHCKTYPGVLDSCVHTGDCGIRSVIVNVHEVVERALSGITLAQLAGQNAATGTTTLHKIQG